MLRITNDWEVLHYFDDKVEVEPKEIKAIKINFPDGSAFKVQPKWILNRVYYDDCGHKFPVTQKQLFVEFEIGGFSFDFELFKHLDILKVEIIDVVEDEELPFTDINLK